MDNTQYSTTFLNCGRNALRYIIRAFSIKELNLPYYTCPSVWQAAKKENCKINFYHIDKNFLPTKEFKKDDFILYTNYFGTSANNVLALADKYKNIIIDNSQAFFMPPAGIASFNSARKFFLVPDGSFVFSKKTLSESFMFDMSYLELEEHYGEISATNYDIYRNRNFDLDIDIRQASDKATNSILNIKMEDEQKSRLEKFKILNKNLSKYNQLKFNLSEYDVPFIYPFIPINDNVKLSIDKSKFETFWSPQNEETTEGFFQRNLIPIPIDFRFSHNYLKNITILDD